MTILVVVVVSISIGTYFRLQRQKRKVLNKGQDDDLVRKGNDILVAIRKGKTAFTEEELKCLQNAYVSSKGTDEKNFIFQMCIAGCMIIGGLPLLLFGDEIFMKICGIVVIMAGLYQAVLSNNLRANSMRHVEVVTSAYPKLNSDKAA